MRKLAAQDPLNAIWTDDLRTFEKARFRQMQAEAAQAAQSRDWPALSQLAAEIDQQNWVEPPPKALVHGLRKADAQLRGEQTRAALADLEIRLNHAFAERDTIRGRLARQDWIALTSGAPLDPNDPIWERVHHPLTWLEEQDRLAAEDHAHDETVAALVAALDDPKHIAPAELERLAHSVLQYGRGMAEGLQQRYVARLQSAEKAQTARFRLVTSAIAAAVVVVASLVIYAIRSSTRASEAEQAGTAMADMIDRGEIKQAEDFLASLQKADAALLSYPPVIEARENLKVLQEKENDRALEFDKAMRAAEQAPVTQLNPPELEAARKLARLETEKQAIEQFAKRRAEELAAQQAKHEKEVNPRLDAIGRQVAELEQKLGGNPAAKIDESAISSALGDAQRDLTGLATELAYVGDKVQALADSLGKKLAAMRSRLDRRRQQAALEAKITEAVAYSPAKTTIDIESFIGALDRYIKQYPDDARSAAFKKTKEEKTLWHGIAAWNAVAGPWKLGETAQLTAKEVKLRAEQCGRFLTQNPGFPATADISLYQKQLEAIARRAPDDDSPTVKIRRLLSDVLVDHVWMVTTKDDADANTKSVVKRYYSARQPTDNDIFVRFSSIVSFEGKEMRRAIPKDKVSYVGLSPQSKIAERFGDIESKLPQWDTVMIDLVEAIIRQRDIDPILQVALLRKVVESAVEGSETLREAFEPLKARLDAANVDANVPWMNPEIPQPGRERALEVVQSLSDVIPQRKQVLARASAVEAGAVQCYVTAGWLAHERDGWRLRTGVALPPRGDLFTIFMLDNKQSGWTKVGAVTDSKPVIDATEPAALAEGRPVFMVASGS